MWSGGMLLSWESVGNGSGRRPSILAWFRAANSEF